MTEGKRIGSSIDQERKRMPIISVKVIQNFFTAEQKKALVSELTTAFCRATFEAARPYIYVMVEEVPEGQWGLGGHPLPDPDFLVNDFVPMVEDAGDILSDVYKVPRRRERGPAAIPRKDR
ncbi:4-oxalocrotonate tautomerase family protein [Sorangium sp. So ce291]|uniref:tautomerase family protein n=1 Tax=Sorangium sp. So ce291 TaxID=3133294 RepID=UPI003F61BDF0